MLAASASAAHLAAVSDAYARRNGLPVIAAQPPRWARALATVLHTRSGAIRLPLLPLLPLALIPAVARAVDAQDA